MAKRKLDVIGVMEVGGVGPGGVVELDDDVINVDALIQGQLVKEHVDAPVEFKSFKKKEKGD